MMNFLYWLRDCFWPTLVLERKAIPDTASQVKWPDTISSITETLEASYTVLKDEMKLEDDRSKIVESNLQGILSLVPLAMTVVFAIVTIFIGGKVGAVSSKVIIVEIIGSYYLALQTLRALIAVINGLSSRDYKGLRIEDVVPQPGETKEVYLNRTCKEIFDIIRENREVTNEKIGQMKLGHAAIKNAVWALFIIIGIILTITVFENYL
jgi:hypothetical protein